jgi:hypothetical protein
MESIMTNIFNGDGRIDTGIDPQTIHPDRRAQYIALAAAQLECERAESAQLAADKAVAEAVRIHDNANAALPRSSFLDEWRRSKSQ